jgi:hypothetical protein
LLPKVCAEQKVEEKEHFVTKKGDKLFCLVEQQSKFIAETKKKKRTGTSNVAQKNLEMLLFCFKIIHKALCPER